MTTKNIGLMQTSALYTLLTYYERTGNSQGVKAVEKELHERELEANS